jgi:hypothetical protein
MGEEIVSQPTGTRQTRRAVKAMAIATGASTSLKAISRAGADRMRSRSPPRASRIWHRLAPKPRSLNHAAKEPTEAPSRSRQIARAPWLITGTSRSKGAACRPRQAVSSRLQPSRAAAQPKVEGAGKARHSAVGRCRVMLAPPPNQKGSPETSMATCRPFSASTGSTLKGTGQICARGSPSSPARARWRGAPKICVASASARRLAGAGPLPYPRRYR